MENMLSLIIRMMWAKGINKKMSMPLDHGVSLCYVSSYFERSEQHSTQTIV